MLRTCPRRNGKQSPMGYWFALAVLLGSLTIYAILSNHAAQADPVADASTPNRSDINAGDKARIAEAYGKLPLSFEADQGGGASRLRFLARGGNSSVALSSTVMVLTLRENGKTAQKCEVSDSKPALSGHHIHSRALRMKLAGASPNARGSGGEELPGKINYF